MFEPHQASRTAALMDELIAALSQVDLLAVADIFRARESPQDNDGLAAALAKGVRSRGVPVLPAQDLAQIAGQLTAACRAGDVIVTMGAGQIGKLADALRNRF